MGKLDKDGGKSLKLTRRQFLQAGAATAAVGAAGFDFAATPSSAEAAVVDKTYHTTCPYCSASCGQLVDVDADGNVLDIYGDHMAPWNKGGLCSKGAGTFQLVNNPRRIGAWATSHPVNNVFQAVPETGDFASGVAYKRIGDGAWERVGLDAALDDIAVKMRDARGPVSPANNHNSKNIAFFGSSHINNDQNNLYRKIIANFGTSNVEHQARI